MTQKLKKKQLYKLVNQMQKQMLYACTYCKTQFNKKKCLFYPVILTLTFYREHLKKSE